MLRALLALILGTLLAWFIRRGTRPRPRPSTPRKPPPKPVGGPMVRDRICDTFLPRDRAIELRRGDELLFFCSSECRDRYLAQVREAR